MTVESFTPADEPPPHPGPGAPPALASAAGDYLARLNPEQRRAVETVDGPLLVLAGAGTGKTRVLTTRFAHILLTGRAFPGQVLAVTFTNKAAREMRERVSAMLGRPAEGLWLGTFHALCARMLRRHAALVGLTSSFTILDTDDQLRLLKQLMEQHGIDAKRWPPPALMGVIQRWKDRGLVPDAVTAAEDTDFAGGRALEVYAAYQQRLRELNAADFGDLPLHVTELLRTRPEVLAQYHRSFRYILVDEYQDTNVVQYLWLRLLAQEHRNICCVGDDDQSIYSWRGAEVENILRFEHDFPGAHVVRLESNYRSTAPILAAASGLIAHNEGRLGKTLRPGRNDSSGEKVAVVGLWDSDEEARMVGGRAEALRAEGHALAEMAILVRAGFQTRAFEERMITLGLPYRVVGGLRFYERAEIRDAVAYMRVLNSPSDDLAFERIVNVPRRGVGDAALRLIHAEARSGAERIPLATATERLLRAGALKGKVREALATLMRQFAEWREALPRDGHVTTLAAMLDESGYTAMWKNDKSPEAPGPAREPARAGPRARGLRDAGRLPRPRGAGDGERGERRRRPPQPDDAARRQGAGVRHRVPARLGGGHLPQPEGARRERHQGAGGGAAPRLRRHHPGAAPRGDLPRRQPAHLRQLAELHPLALPRRAAGRARGARGLGGHGARAAHRRRAQRVLLRPPAGAPPQGDGRVGAAGAAGARGPAGGGRPGVPPEVRLRHRHRGGGRPPGRLLRDQRRQAAAGPVRGKGVMPCASGVGPQGSGSFLKKRTKKLLSLRHRTRPTFGAQGAKVFLLLFLQKKKNLPSFPSLA